MEEQELLEELGRLHSRLAAQQRLSAITAHDLSSPVQVILGLTEVVLDHEDLLPEVRHRVEQVHRSAETLAALIADLSRGFGLDDPAHLHLEWINLVDLAESVSARVRLLAEASRITLLTLAPDAVRSGAWVDADRIKLERALVNVLGNAIKFSPEGSTVTLRVEHGDHRAWVSVSDEGPGIGDQARARIFEPFHRDGSTAHVPGSGLGLFIARQILEIHGGAVEIADRPGPGTTFVLELPRAGHLAPAAPVTELGDAR